MTCKLAGVEGVAASAGVDRACLRRRGTRLEGSADQRRHFLDAEAEELDPLDDAVAAQVGQCREERLARLVLAKRADDEKPLREVAAHEPAQQRQRRPVGPLEIVQHEDEPLAGHTRESLLERRGIEPALADRVGEGLVGNKCLLAATAVEHRRAQGRRVDCEPRGQPRLAAAGLACDQADAHALALTAAEVREAFELARPPDEELRVDPAKLCRNTLGGCVRAKRLRNASRLLRRPHAQGLQEPRPKLRERCQRRGAIARCREAPHQRAVSLLRERLERGGAPRQIGGPAQVARCLRGRGELLEHGRRAGAVLVAGFERPLVLEPRQELAVGERKRLLELPGRAQPLGLAHVDPDAVAQTDAVAGGDEHPVGLLAELPPQRPERAP